MKIRIMILSLCLAGALAVPALALTTSTADVENAEPIAEDLTLTTESVRIFFAPLVYASPIFIQRRLSL